MLCKTKNKKTTIKKILSNCGLCLNSFINSSQIRTKNKKKYDALFNHLGWTAYTEKNQIKKIRSQIIKISNIQWFPISFKYVNTDIPSTIMEKIMKNKKYFWAFCSFPQKSIPITNGIKIDKLPRTKCKFNYSKDHFFLYWVDKEFQIPLINLYQYHLH